MYKRAFLFTATFLLVFIFVFTVPANHNQALASAPLGSSFIRVVHASPDAPNVDVWVDGTIAITNLAFTEITPYLSVPSGDHTIEVVPTGAMDPKVIDVTVNFASATDYTVAAINPLATIEAKVFVDDNTLPALGKAHIRFIHLSPDAPAVDVAISSGPVLISNVAFPNASGYLPVDVGTYDLDVRPAGGTSVVLAVPDVMLENQTVYTVFAFDELANLEAAIFADSGMSRLRVVHVSPDAPNVDVWVDEMLVLENVPFKAVSSYLTVPSGPHLVEITATGDTTPVLSEIVTLVPNQDYTAAAGDLVANLTLFLLMDDNTLPDWDLVAPEMAHVRFIHLSPDAPAVDVAVSGGSVLFSNVAFGVASDYLPVMGGTYDLDVLLTGTNTVALAVPDVMLQAGNVYTIFAMGLANDEPPLEAVLNPDAEQWRLLLPTISVAN